jgi:hypothetical protein
MPDGSNLVSRADRRVLRAEARRRERRHLADGVKAAAARLILDPLEPRVLLNADTLAVQIASLPNEAAAHDVTTCPGVLSKQIPAARRPLPERTR